ncbi:glutathione peroxidase [uncultured Pseudoteredinibacter sp.]|uniref:glutathione peroxidase n=1 Tax=uncultured Pseudoteredinibacter sp. TaxID=1641701 RepID=UPI002611258C|nr:glutathione peroxidase [uncultured Pseudoteredinibacter sp.]
MRLRQLLFVLPLFTALSSLAADCPDILKFEARKLRSSERVNFCEKFSGKPLLVVNTASHCGYTGQFADLQVLYEKYQPQGLEVVGFPSNDFKQEAKDEAKTAEVCYINYGVKFTMMSSSPVTGDDANTLFKELADKTGKEPKWNFNKYLVSPDGTQVKYFPSKAKPLGGDLEAAIQQSLQNES